MATTLQAMPGEIVVHISRFLNTNDLCSLRRTCKQLEAAVYRPFVREFFVKKQFMLTEPSLQALIDIAEHPQLGGELQHLIIGLDHFNISAMTISTVRGIDDKQTALIDGVVSQRHIITSGVARDMLAHAMRHLPNLATVDIRDFMSRSRHRDHGSWSSLGAKTAARLTGHALSTSAAHDSTSYNNLPDVAFSTVISALGHAGRSGVAVETVLRDTRWGLSGSGAAFPLPRYAAAQTEPVLRSMKKLHLDILFGDRAFSAFGSLATNHPRQSSHIAPDGTKYTWMHSSPLQTFLSQTMNLTWLRLNFQWTVSASPISLLNWVALPPSVPAPIRFTAPLERLDLGRTQVEPKTLAAVIIRFKDTLQAIGLWDICIIVSPSDLKDRENPCTNMFKQLSANLPHLREVVIGKLRLDDQRGHLCNVGFKEKASDSPPPSFSRVFTGYRDVKHRGSGAASFLRDLAGRVVADWDDARDDVSVDSDASEDEDEDMDDDGFVVEDDDEDDDNDDNDDED